MNALVEAPSEGLRVRKPADAPPIVLFTGGKGGVGKTLLAANTAIELAKRAHRVLLVDLDLGLADLDVVLKLSARHTIEDALHGRAKLADCVVRGPAGVSVLAAGSGTPGMARLDAGQRAQLFTELFELARGYDVVVADSAAGIGPDVLDACLAADHVFVVTTPEPAALTDAYGLIKALHAQSERDGREVPTPELVVNQSRSVEEAEFTAAKLRSVCERFLARSPRSAGWMPSSPAVARSAASQRPFALDADTGLPWSCLARLATRLERLCLGPAVNALPQGVTGHGR